MKLNINGCRSYCKQNGIKNYAELHGIDKEAEDLYKILYTKLSKSEQYKRTGNFNEDYRRQTALQRAIEEEILNELVYVN